MKTSRLPRKRLPTLDYPRVCQLQKSGTKLNKTNNGRVGGLVPCPVRLLFDVSSRLFSLTKVGGKKDVSCKFKKVSRFTHAPCRAE